MSKQTALDWLKKQLESYGDPSNLKLDWETLDELIEQAKQMEKEQLENVFKEAQECAVKADGVYFKHESFDKLYNETYGGNNDN